MKRRDLYARTRFLAEKRAALMRAAKEFAGTAQDCSSYAERVMADLEVRAIEYAVAVQRYLGGKT